MTLNSEQTSGRAVKMLLAIILIVDLAVLSVVGYGLYGYIEQIRAAL